MPQPHIATFDEPMPPEDRSNAGASDRPDEVVPVSAEEPPSRRPGYLLPVFVEPPHWARTLRTGASVTAVAESEGNAPTSEISENPTPRQTTLQSANAIDSDHQESSIAPTAPLWAQPPQQSTTPMEAPRTLTEKPPPQDKGTVIRNCPVCERPLLTPGLSRHQQCEGRTVTSRTPAPSTSEVESPSTAARRAQYLHLVRRVERKEEAHTGQRREVSRHDPVRLSEARTAVLLRCLGLCENPGCSGQPQDVTDSGDPILEVDHVERIAEGGRDHPVQMVALCPNCHAMKERGRNRSALQRTLATVAAQAHAAWTAE
ncbi:HNH endonuclease signature motif containing protein [Streptomyces mirabilis]|uniref:HNH endonuclease signature motif containing protein n=1 Tax=Streptomyces mirabilis TaxID=68239 RepID=UPI0036B5B3E7